MRCLNEKFLPKLNLHFIYLIYKGYYKSGWTILTIQY